jgi:dihydroorotate dehydrogenase electron transfer subunit
MGICYSSAVWQLQGVVIENRRQADYSTLVVEVPPIADAAQPGQFVMAAVHGEGTVPSPLLKRALAVYARLPAGGVFARIGLLLKVVGEGTRRLASVLPGDTLDLVGPLGRGFDLERAAGKINLVVAGGTGIASVCLLVERLLRRGEEVRLIYGGRTSRDLVGIEDFEALQVPVTAATEDGSRGVRGLVTDALVSCLASLPAPLVNVYTCGPNRMMQAVSDLVVPLGIPCQISVEMKMACGFGVCLGCTVKTREGYRLACTHGPVFDAEGFVWEPTAALEAVR